MNIDLTESLLSLDITLPVVVKTINQEKPDSYL